MHRCQVLLAEALGPNKTTPTWVRLSGLLARPPVRRTLIFVLTAQGASGLDNTPPGALCITFGSNAQTLAVEKTDAKVAMERLLLESMHGSHVETLADLAHLRPLAARMTQLAQQQRDNAQTPVAAEAWGRMFLCKRGRIYKYSPARFLVRPQKCLLSAAGTTAAPRMPGIRLIECNVSREGDKEARLTYRDGDSYQLSEVIPLEHLPEHLPETEALLRKGTTSCVLSISGARDLESMARRRFSELGKSVPVEVEGKFPFTLSLLTCQEQFLAGSELGWDAAALAILSTWPPEALGRIAVSGIEVAVDGIGAVGLMKLYLRSLVLRKLWAHIGRTVGLKAPSEA
jgi:hypothetical protein